MCRVLRRRNQYDFGHDRISSPHSRLLIVIILYIVCIEISHLRNVTYYYTVNGLRFHPQSKDVVLTSRLMNGVRRQIKEEQSIGRGAVGEGNDDKKDDLNNSDKDQQHFTSSYAQQRHPNYYYTNGNRVSSTTKSAYSYYDYNDDASYYNRNSKNKNSRRNHIYNYTTKLSDVYWCLLIALGWTIWMIHSIASLRQQHYNTMMSLSDNDPINPIRNINIDTMQRLFQTKYKSLLLIRGHVLDIIPNPVLPTDTPIVSLPTYTVVVDYVVERQQQQPLSPVTTTTTTKHDVTTLPTIMSDNIKSNEFIQIRKHFETTLSDIEIGFGNIELLVLPNDPMCSIIKYDYDTYIDQEQRIQRVIEQEQYDRIQRRYNKKRKKLKKRKIQQQQQQQSSSSLPYRKSNNTSSSERIVIDHSEHFDPDSTSSTMKETNPTTTRPNLEIDTTTTTTYNKSEVQDDLKYHNDNENDHDDDDDDDDDVDDDDIFGCDMCCSYCDCNYDQYQWKRLSLFFAILLVIASIIGTIHVVFRMDIKDRWLGWMTVCIGLVLLLPIAIWIHKVMIICHRWSESQPEKQGYIVQSSTMTGTITSYNNNGDEPNNNSNNINNTNTLPIHNNPNLPNMMTLTDACMKPSCNDLMDDICDPNCSNHTFTTSLYQPHTSRLNNNPTEFSYVVPEMTGCYFIHYPRKNQQHQHHDHRNTSKCSRKLQQINERHDNNTKRPHITSHDSYEEEEEDITGGGPNIGIETQVSPTTMDNSIIISEVIMDNHNLSTIPSSSLHTMKRNNSLSSSSVVSGAGGVSILSTSSVSSISSNDDPTMKQLSLWNSMIHVVNKMRSTDDADSN